MVVKKCPESYRTIMYKVFMIIIANKFAKTTASDFLATGNSWGQVASQTPQNIRVCSQISELPIISPLLGYSKDDTIRIAQKIGTYAPSTCDGTDDCCVMYLPKHPELRAKLGSIKKYIALIEKEAELDSISHNIY